MTWQVEALGSPSHPLLVPAQLLFSLLLLVEMAGGI